jgi:hypothetical protein
VTFPRDQRVALWGMLTVSAMLLLASLGCAPYGEHPVVTRAKAIPVHLSGYTPAQTGNSAAALQHFEARVEWLGVTMAVLPEEAVANEVYGMAATVDGKKTIWLPAVMAADARFEVLAHEAAHLFAPPTLDQAQGEVFAEIVAYEVTKAFGYDHLEAAAQYCASWKPGLAAVPVLQADIDAVVTLLVGAGWN